MLDPKPVASMTRREFAQAKRNLFTQAAIRIGRERGEAAMARIRAKFEDGSARAQADWEHYARARLKRELAELEAAKAKAGSAP